MTRLQAVITQAGVSAQAAHTWQKAAKLDDAVVDRYIAAAKTASDDITVAGLLSWANPAGTTGGGVGGDGGESGGAFGGGDDGDDDGIDDGDDDGDGDDDTDRPTHVCPHCRCLVVCDRGDA